MVKGTKTPVQGTEQALPGTEQVPPGTAPAASVVAPPASVVPPDPASAAEGDPTPQTVAKADHDRVVAELADARKRQGDTDKAVASHESTKTELLAVRETLATIRKQVMDGHGSEAYKQMEREMDERAVALTQQAIEQLATADKLEAGMANLGKLNVTTLLQKVATDKGLDLAKLTELAEDFPGQATTLADVERLAKWAPLAVTVPVNDDDPTVASSTRDPVTLSTAEGAGAQGVRPDEMSARDKLKWGAANPEKNAKMKK